VYAYAPVVEMMRWHFWSSRKAGEFTGGRCPAAPEKGKAFHVPAPRLAERRAVVSVPAALMYSAAKCGVRRAAHAAGDSFSFRPQPAASSRQVSPTALSCPVACVSETETKPVTQVETLGRCIQANNTEPGLPRS